MRLAARHPHHPSAIRTSVQSDRAQKRNRCRGYWPSDRDLKASQLANSFTSSPNPAITVKWRTPRDDANREGSLHVHAITALCNRHYGLANGRLNCLASSSSLQGATLPRQSKHFRQIQQDRARVSSHANHLRLSSNDTDGRWTNRPRHLAVVRCSLSTSLASKILELIEEGWDESRIVNEISRAYAIEHRGRAPGRLRFHRSSTKAPDCAGHRFRSMPCDITGHRDATYQ